MIQRNLLVLLVLLFSFSLLSFAKKPRTAAPLTIKVVVVYEDPVLPMYGGKRLHECFRPPSVPTRLWNDPVALSAEYEKTLEAVSGQVVNYEIVKEIQADHFFTYLKNDPLKRSLTTAEVAQLMAEPDWKTLKEIGTSYDYNAMVKHYGFDKMRDNGEIHEVWVWTFPYGGMWESHMMGKDAFWINSEPNANPSCTELLSIMGLNYERDLACAMESYGHRFESTMMQVFGWWDYDKKAKKEDLTMWERYTGYIKNYDKFDKGNTNIGNIHFPPNGEFDYNWKNTNKVLTYADDWANYPNVKEKKGRLIDCSEWNCEHIGYMKWWFSHIPHFEGVNPKDGKLNNWWHYVVDYNDALRKEQSLNK